MFVKVLITKIFLRESLFKLGTFIIQISSTILQAILKLDEKLIGFENSKKEHGRQY